MLQGGDFLNGDGTGSTVRLISLPPPLPPHASLGLRLTDGA